MSIWKIVSGVLSIVLCFFVIFQSCAAGFLNAISQNGQSSGSAGLIVAVLMLAGGIISIATRNALGNGGNIAIIIIYGIAAVIGYLMAGSYADLVIWATWCIVCAVVSACAIASDNVCDLWVYAVIVVIGVVIAAVGFVMNSGDKSDTITPPAIFKENDKNDESESGKSGDQPESETNGQDGAGNLGDYHVEIKGMSLANDTDGDPAIVITYAWTNNSDKTTSAEVALMEKAFQDGIQLDTAFILDNSVYDSGLGFKDVRPGSTLDIQAAYSLTSETSPVEFELSEFISFSDELVTKVFEITD